MTKSYNTDTFTQKQIQEIIEWRKGITGVKMSSSAVITWGINVLWEKIKEETNEKETGTRKE